MAGWASIWSNFPRIEHFWTQHAHEFSLDDKRKWTRTTAKNLQEIIGWTAFTAARWVVVVIISVTWGDYVFWINTSCTSAEITPLFIASIIKLFLLIQLRNHFPTTTRRTHFASLYSRTRNQATLLFPTVADTRLTYFLFFFTSILSIVRRRVSTFSSTAVDRPDSRCGLRRCSVREIARKVS